MRHPEEGLPEPAQPDELFVSFANTLSYDRGEPVDAIPDSDALLAWLRSHDLLSSRGQAAEAGKLRREPGEAARRLGRFQHLREVLQGAAADVSAHGRPTRQRVRELNQILRRGMHYHQLLLQPGGGRYTVAQVGDRLDQARAAIASSLAYFLADDAAARLRVCANEQCRFVFVDRSPAGRRRWCDMRTCGNQAKVARHRARLRARQAGAGVSGVAASG
jgi:predicted RNA-binding Zn ribbon-like protein